MYLLRTILFSLFCFQQLIKCEVCPSERPDINSPNFGENCRFSVITNAWYTCITNSENSKAYFLINSDNICLFSSKCKSIIVGGKVVRGTNECIVSCTSINDTLKANFIEYGEYCIYSANNENIFGKDNYNKDFNDYDIIPNNGYKILKCNKVEKVTHIDDADYTECFDGSLCQTSVSYFDYETHKCLGNCGTKKEI